MARATEQAIDSHMTTLVLPGEAGVSRRRYLDLMIAAAAVLMVAAPLLFTHSGFAVDFTNHLWLSWAQGTELARSGHPSYFLNARGVGVFYPWFAFYGGTLYAITGGVSDLLGNQPIAAFAAVTTLAIAGSYGGMLWLGRQFGLRGLPAHAPALAVLTSAYYITDLYGRGAWPEFMAVAAIAPLLASAVHLARARSWHVGPVSVFVISAIVFFGSHNITLVWGTSVAILAAVLVWLALGAPRALPARRLAMLAGLAVASLAVNAWYLVPDIAYAKDVRAHALASHGVETLFFDTPAILFDPLRTVPARSTTPALYVQVPVWFLAWGLLAGALLMWRRGRDRRLRRVWVSVAVLIAILLALIMISAVWSVAPFPFNSIQFPYRLNSYVFYAVAGLVLASALGLQRAGTTRTVAALRWALAGVCAISVCLCVWQLWVPNTLFPQRGARFVASYANRREALTSVDRLPRSWYDPFFYGDIQAPLLETPPGRVLIIPPASVHGDRFAAWLNVPPGPVPIQTNIAGGSYLVHISGLRRIGRSQYGEAVVRREREGSGPVHVVVETTHSALLELSWAVSVLGCVSVLGVLAWIGIGGRRAARVRRRAATGAGSPA